MLELWGMGSIPSLLSLPGSLWPRVVAPDRVLYIGQIKLSKLDEPDMQDTGEEAGTNS